MQVTNKNLARSILHSGINPVTGEYLSATERRTLFKRTKIQGSKVFAKSNSFAKIGSAFGNRTSEERISLLENKVFFLTRSIENEAKEEKKLQRLFERRTLAARELKSFRGEEKQLENTAKKVISPITNVVAKTANSGKGVLDTIKEFFLTTLGGWLANQGFDAIDAWGKGDTEKLEEIKNNVTDVLGKIGLAFAAFKVGIPAILITAGLVGAAIRGMASALWRKIFVRKSIPTPKPKPPKPTPKPSGAGGKYTPSSRYKFSSNAFQTRPTSFGTRVYNRLPSGFRRSMMSFQTGLKGPGAGFNVAVGGPKPTGFAYRSGSLFGNISRSIPRIKIPKVGGRGFTLGGLKPRGGLKTGGVRPTGGGLWGILLGMVASQFIPDLGINAFFDQRNAQAVYDKLLKMPQEERDKEIKRLQSVFSRDAEYIKWLGGVPATIEDVFLGIGFQRSRARKNIAGLSLLFDKMDNTDLSSLNIDGANKETDPDSIKPTGHSDLSPPPKQTTPAPVVPEIKPPTITPPSLEPIDSNLEPEIIQINSDNGSGDLAPDRSTTKAPSISSSNPDNFYALYSQVIYNVVV